MADEMSLRLRLIGAVTDAIRGLDETGDAVDGVGGRMKALGAVGATVGASIGGLLAKGFADNMALDAGRDKLAAQLGLTTAESEKAGRVAGKVYANNWGESTEEVNTALKSVANNLMDVGDTSEASLQQATEAALALSSVFEVDVTESTQAAAALIKNGLAKNSTEAFDIITTGFQGGMDKAGDFLDTLTEYSPQFAKIGIDGPHALALLGAGLKAGARDTDTIADAFKEFGLRAIDGSKATSDGYKAIGLDATKTAQAIAAGGPAAQKATMSVLIGLNNIKDPIKQNAAGVALFGTTWEDTLRKVLPAMAGATAGTQNVAGATQRMADTVGDNAAGKIETMRRKFEQWTQGMASSQGPLGLVTTGALTFGGTALAAGGQLGALVAGLSAMNIGATASAVASRVAAAATKVWAAGQWLLNAALSANPIGIVIIVVAALAAAFVIAYNRSATFRSAVQAAGRAGQAAMGWILDKGRAVASWFSGAFQAISRFMSNPVENGSRLAMNALGRFSLFVATIPGKVQGAFSGAGSWLINAGRNIISGLISGVSSMLGSLQSKLSSVTNLIPDWKGPPARDAMLLHGAGRSIMGGLIGGIDSQLPALESTLGGVTSTIGGTGLSAPQMAARGGGGPTIVVNVTNAVVGNESAIARVVTNALNVATVRGLKLGMVAR